MLQCSEVSVWVSVPEFPISDRFFNYYIAMDILHVLWPWNLHNPPRSSACIDQILYMNKLDRTSEEADESFVFSPLSEINVCILQYESMCFSYIFHAVVEIVTVNVCVQNIGQTLSIKQTNCIPGGLYRALPWTPGEPLSLTSHCPPPRGLFT